jgi:hypothetical protein
VALGRPLRWLVGSQSALAFSRALHAALERGGELLARELRVTCVLRYELLLRLRHQIGTAELDRAGVLEPLSRTSERAVENSGWVSSSRS